MFLSDCESRLADYFWMIHEAFVRCHSSVFKSAMIFCSDPLSSLAQPRYFLTTWPFLSSTYMLSFFFPGSDLVRATPFSSHHSLVIQLMNSLPVSGWPIIHLKGNIFLITIMLSLVAVCPLFHCARRTPQYRTAST